MKLNLELSQNIILSQKTIQSINILQMSADELETYIKELSIENPVIDLEESPVNLSSHKDLNKPDYISNNIFNNDSSSYSDDSDEEKDPWNFTKNTGESLEDVLISQIDLKQFNKNELATMRYMIKCIDQRGYLVDSIEDLMIQTHAPMSMIEKLLNILQSLEPIGIGARNLEECLLIQVNKLYPNDYIAKSIVENYMAYLAKNQLHIIAKKLHVTLEDVYDAAHVIKTLDPKPGSIFSSMESSNYVTPDVILLQHDHHFEIVLNESSSPKFTINKYYQNLLTTNIPTDVRHYVEDKVNQIQWISQCINQRNHTLHQVVSIIVDIQKEFFEKGAGHLIPMKLADVATIMNVHESTVSRAVKDKYIQCTWGTYPLHSFFSKGINVNNYSQEMTAENIKDLIKDIVENENKKKPLSDRLIEEALKNKGVTISRRTVAKYRESLGIKDASGRKIRI